MHGVRLTSSIRGSRVRDIIIRSQTRNRRDDLDPKNPPWNISINIQYISNTTVKRMFACLISCTFFYQPTLFFSHIKSTNCISSHMTFWTSEAQLAGHIVTASVRNDETVTRWDCTILLNEYISLNSDICLHAWHLFNCSSHIYHLRYSAGKYWLVPLGWFYLVRQANMHHVMTDACMIPHFSLSFFFSDQMTRHCQGQVGQLKPPRDARCRAPALHRGSHDCHVESESAQPIRGVYSPSNPRTKKYTSICLASLCYYKSNYFSFS